MTSQEFQEKIHTKLPDLPGVYFFIGPYKEILYIGKATSLRDRVKSYFNKDLLVTRGRLVQQMVVDAVDIDFNVTDSVLEALILETNLIKKYQPKANTKEKDDKSFNHVVITNEDYPQVILVRSKSLGFEFPESLIKYDFGPYPEGAQLREALRIVRKIFPFRDQKCIPAEEQMKAGKTPRPCFNAQIGLCPGVCTGKVTDKEYAKIINHIRLFFEGKKSALIKELEKEMMEYADKQEFEKAQKIKRTLFALSHIQDISLIKSNFRDVVYVPTTAERESGSEIFRIEAYDIAHMSGKDMTGAMVVIENGEINKAEYRKFKIRTIKKSNDVGALKEVLKRRFKHPEWRMPNVIAVDGNDVQKNAAEELLKELFGEQASQIDVVAVVKDNRHKPKAVIGKGEIVDQFSKDILLANNEAHRFVIAYHKKLRSDIFRD